MEPTDTTGSSRAMLERCARAFALTGDRLIEELVVNGMPRENAISVLGQVCAAIGTATFEGDSPRASTGANSGASLDELIAEVRTAWALHASGADAAFDGDPSRGCTFTRRAPCGSVLGAEHPLDPSYVAALINEDEE